MTMNTRMRMRSCKRPSRCQCSHTLHRVALVTISVAKQTRMVLPTAQRMVVVVLMMVVMVAAIAMATLPWPQRSARRTWKTPPRRCSTALRPPRRTCRMPGTGLWRSPPTWLHCFVPCCTMPTGGRW